MLWGTAGFLNGLSQWSFTRLHLVPHSLLGRSSRDLGSKKAVERLNHCLIAAKDWLGCSTLELNPANMEGLLVGGPCDSELCL